MLNSGYKVLIKVHTNCNQWMDSAQTCKDTAFEDTLLFHLDINLNDKSTVELPNLDRFPCQQHISTETHQQITKFECDSPQF